MARLSICLLGPFHATLDGEPITGFRSDKARALLAYLAVEAERPHSRDRLAGLLWPDRPERAAHISLRAELSHLRQLIGDHNATIPTLTVTHEAVQFNCASDHRLDIAEFCAHTEKQRDGPLVTEELETAIRLYRGPFLEGFALKDSPDFDDWCLLTRERLLRTVLEACRRLASHYERADDLERASEVARRALELEPASEEAHRQLMRLLALSGRRTEALKQYEACRRLLADELGVEPTAETSELYEALRASSDPRAAPRLPVHNLPLQTAPLVGREAELATIAHRLGSGACRLLTLLGPGGSGKTRLALEAAARQIDDHADGVFFVSLESARSAGAVIGAIAQAIGLASFRVDDPQRDARRRLLDYLRRKQLLLVLDSFEHLLDGSRSEVQDLLGQILGAAPRVRLLVTSRARLNLADEHLLPMSGLEFPPPHDGGTSLSMPMGALLNGQAPSAGAEDKPVGSADSAPRFSAVALFLQATSRAQPGFTPTPDDLQHIAHICRLVQGMPLPLLLAASWANILTPAEIASQIAEQGLDFLETGSDTGPERQRSMRATFDYSWRLLGEHHRAVLMSLAVCRGGCTLQAATQVAGTSLRDLRALADRSLVQRGPAGRWEMHELLREYAAEQLDCTTDGGASSRDRHAAYYTAAAAAWRASLRGPRQGQVSAEMAPDVANIQAAWGWALQRGRFEWLEQMLDGLCGFYERSARLREGALACQAAAETLASRPVGNERLLARVFTWQAVFDWLLGHTDAADAFFRRSLGILETLRVTGLDIRAEEAAALLGLACLLDQTGERDESRALCEQSLARYQALEDRHGAAEALCRLGVNAIHTGHCDAARELLEESLAIHRSLGDQAGAARALRHLTLLSENVGELEQAADRAQECIAIARAAQDQEAFASALHELACTRAYQGDFTAVHRLLEEVIALCDDLGLPDLAALAQDNLIWIKINLGDYDSARPLALANLTRFRQIGDARGAGLGSLSLGEIALAEGHLDDALELLTKSAHTLGKIGQRDEQALALAGLAEAASLLRQPELARVYLRLALQAASETKHFPASLFGVASAAVCLAGEGQAERAVELYSLAARYPYIGNSCWRDDVAGKHIAALAASLPPDTVAAAQARGRARDLRLTLAELVSEFGRADRDERSVAPFCTSQDEINHMVKSTRNSPNASL